MTREDGKSQSPIPDRAFSLPENSLFTHVDQESLPAHLHVYIPSQELQMRHVSFGTFHNPNYLFKGDEGLFPHEISELKQLLGEINEGDKRAIRISMQNRLAEALKAPDCILFPKSGKGRSWMGKMRDLPQEYQTQVASRSGFTGVPNTDDFIVFSLTSL